MRIFWRKKRLQYVQAIVDGLFRTGVITGEVWSILTKAIERGDINYEWDVPEWVARMMIDVKGK